MLTVLFCCCRFVCFWSTVLIVFPCRRVAAVGVGGRAGRGEPVGSVGEPRPGHLRRAGERDHLPHGGVRRQTGRAVRRAGDQPDRRKEDPTPPPTLRPSVVIPHIHPTLIPEPPPPLPPSAD